MLQNASAPLAPIDGLAVASLPVLRHTAKYDLSLFVTETDDGLTCTWEYCTDLFLPETIARLHTHFETLLAGIVAEPETAVAQLPLLSATETETILRLSQGEADDTVPHIGLHQRFEEWVELQPEMTAVTDEYETLTYRQLNQRANQLARLFRQHGVQPGQPIAIHLPGSVPAITAILACHKARAAYVPFDPAYPHHRLQFISASAFWPVDVIQGFVFEELFGGPGDTVTVLQMDTIGITDGQGGFNYYGTWGLSPCTSGSWCGGGVYRGSYTLTELNTVPAPASLLLVALGLLAAWRGRGR